MTYREIAATMDVPIGTVMTWLHRARARLRETLEEATP
jgi:RNA polymerase sigma-70 factor (ECF subfamily)